MVQRISAETATVTEKEHNKMLRKWLYEIGKRERNIKEYHPLLSQLVIGVITGIIVTFLIWAFRGCILFNTKAASERKTDNTSQITIKNEGIMSSNDVYQFVTPSTVVMGAPTVTFGAPYVSSIEPVANNKYRVYLKDLPANQKVILDLNTGEVSVKKQ
jgi:hypothetical protein